MVNPVRFETLDKDLKLAIGTVEAWSKEPGFPLAGSGVALQDAVVEWRKALEPDTAEITLQPPLPFDPPSEKPASEKPADSERDGDVVWITIRVPIAITGPTLPGSNPVQAMRIASSERHIKDTWGKVLHGCRAGKARLMSGRQVQTSSDSLKFVFEQICDAISKA